MSSTKSFVNAHVYVKISDFHMKKKNLVDFLNSVKFLKGKLKIGKCNVRHNEDDEGNKYTTAVATYSLVNNTKKCKDALEILIDRITTPSEHGWYISAGENHIFVIPDKKSGLTWTKRVGAYSTCYSSQRDDCSVASSCIDTQASAVEQPEQETAPPRIEDFPPLGAEESRTPAKADLQTAAKVEKAPKHGAYQLFEGGKPGKIFLSMEEAITAKKNSEAFYKQAHEESGIEPVPLEICGLVRGPVVG